MGGNHGYPDTTDISPERTAVFTSGLVWIFHERRIAERLFWR
jgi:hypothetical protein